MKKFNLRFIVMLVSLLAFSIVLVACDNGIKPTSSTTQETSATSATGSSSRSESSGSGSGSGETSGSGTGTGESGGTVTPTPTKEFKVTFSVASDNSTRGTLTATVDGNVKNSSPITVKEETDVTFTAKPSANYEVDKWTVDGVENTDGKDTLTLKVPKETTVTVYLYGLS